MSEYSEKGPERLHLPSEHQTLVKMRDKAVKNLQSSPRKSSLCVPHPSEEDKKQRRTSFVRFDDHEPEFIERLTETESGDVEKAGPIATEEKPLDEPQPEDEDILTPPALNGEEHKIKRWTDSLKIKRRKSRDDHHASIQLTCKDSPPTNEIVKNSDKKSANGDLEKSTN
eukprot:TRINITY_DN9720_c0_g1_i3.p1 TRINITY_DN9720_c0_g1~~TRINITY_DN9720_c0_g1_i3.p1  ORF type:complete len:170 (-),score=28.66 TRINITY_DN9720_c0_g1_i3:59-568(-)